LKMTSECSETTVDKSDISDMDVDTTRKRKLELGTSGGLSPELKRSSSSPNVGEMMSERYKSDSTDPESLRMEDIIVNSFQKDSFIAKISPVISLIIQPAVTAAVNTAVANAVSAIEKSVVVPLKKQNKQLSEKVDIIERNLKLKSDKVEALERELKLKVAEADQKNETILNLQCDISSLQRKADDLEQYGRRTSLRFFNIPGEGDRERVVLDIINKQLKVSVTSEDIERCHPLRGGQTLVKFKGYKTKAAVFKAKSALKGNPDNIFVTEDLTKQNHEMVKELLMLRKNRSIDSFWTVDGKIYVKGSAVSQPVRIFGKADIPKSAVETTTEG
ncbi:MAG: hypothetical protein AB2693_33035, partial [Candidatus Thiodiazotropha sp.]